VIAFIIVAIGAYLIGSIPSGYLAGRIAGIDIRSVGSGNIGATNVTRALGKGYGYAVFAADFSKGLTAVIVAKLIGQRQASSLNSYEVLQIVAAISCVLGNAFPLWLRFRGGKGVATSAGVVFALMPLAALIGVVVWVASFQLSRYVSLASIIAALTLPITVAVLLHFGLMNDSLLLYVSMGLAAVVLLRHRSNLSRLIRGTEQSFRRSRD
jgi:glycerol-3-phosphate acyltransferase PlsY